jgi:hypothetical protein
VKRIYEPDESHRAKHRGDSADARLTVDEDGRLVCKCSNEIDTMLAQRLLDEGLPWSPATHRSPLPHSVFNVYRGIPYRAHRRGRTRFYHGFPDVKQRIPAVLRAQLRERAVNQGAEDAFDAWMRQTEEYT